MRLRKDGVETRQRILEAAVQVFSQKGYRDATHAEICELAGTNTAAINYHFRDKEALYVEAWRQAFHCSLKAHPPDGGIPAEAPAEKRLRGRVISILRRIADPESHEFEMVHRELANPTGLLAEVMRESIEPIRMGFLAVVRELLGERASDQQVQLCQMSIRAQCLDLMMRARLRGTSPEGRGCPIPEPLELDVEAIADHITRFSLAGLREIRRQIEGGEP